VAIARALITDPAIILADEPTGNLDSKSGAEIMDLFHEMHKVQGLTIVMVTHDPDIAAQCERVIHIRDGKILSDERNGQRRHVSTIAEEVAEAVEAAGVVEGAGI
jgi:putative ABC transport system ATP-binding protein